MRDIITGLLVALAGVIGISLWRRREAEASGSRRAKQEQEDQRRSENDRAIRALRAEKALMLAERIEQDAREAEARRLAEAATATPPPAAQSAEDVLEQARKEQEDRSRIQ